VRACDLTHRRYSFDIEAYSERHEFPDPSKPNDCVTMHSAVSRSTDPRTHAEQGYVRYTVAYIRNAPSEVERFALQQYV
jgi:hypothetical protein